jgi:methylated-DNA-[protein]-cysteine S-methyltransferase
MSRYPEGIWCDDLLPAFRKAVMQYFAGESTEFPVEVDLSGSADFHQRVLRACRKVPFGETISYGGLAGKVGHPGAARAVGQAMACNPVPLVIPCHRVVAANGRLGGFSSPSGARAKLRLLRLENPLYEPAGGRTGKKRPLSDREDLLFAEAS